MPDETTEAKAHETEKPEPQGIDWKSESRKHERRAKESNARVKELEAENARLREESESRSKEQADEEQKTSDELQRYKARVKELEASQRRSEIVRDVAAQTGVDRDLLDRMRGDSEEELQDAAKAIADAFQKASKSSWPAVRDNGNAKAPHMTRDEILAIEDQSMRVEAIAKHPELFRKR